MGLSGEDPCRFAEFQLDVSITAYNPKLPIVVALALQQSDRHDVPCCRGKYLQVVKSVIVRKHLWAVDIRIWSHTTKRTAFLSFGDSRAIKIGEPEFSADCSGGT